MYCCFEKGCLTNEEKLTRQCRKLLWAMVVDCLGLIKVKVFQPVKGNSANPCIITPPSFLHAQHRQPQSSNAKLLMGHVSPKNGMR